jgi:hypothetical protein
MPVRTHVFAGAVLAGALVAAGLGAPGALAADPTSGLPSPVPVSYTPAILGTSSSPRALLQVGTQLVVGGTFNTGVQQHGSSTVFHQNYLFEMNAATGVLDTSFHPALNGVVQALAAGPIVGGDPTAYVGGLFSTVNGAKSKSLALVDLVSGALVPGFKVPALNGMVNAMAVDDGMLFVGGTFTTVNSTAAGGITTLNASTGAYLPYVAFGVTTNHNWTSTCTNCDHGAVGVQALTISPNGTRMVLIGNFKTAGGLARDQVAMVDLGSSSATVDPNWATQRYTAACSYWAYDSYVRAVQFSQDGSYFVITTTGGGGRPQTGDENCDSTARFDTGTSGLAVAPTWSDYSGNDSFYGLAVTPAAIFVGGHNRWLNNPNGSDHAGPGAVPRPSIAALDPLNGLPYSWNPGRHPRGADTYTILATSTGVWFGYDTDWIGNYKYNRPEIAFFPYAGGETLPPDQASRLPGNVYLAGQSGANSLLRRSYNGSTAGTTTTVGGAPVNWSQVRGAFMANGTLFYGDSDGNMYSVTYNGTSWGKPALVQPFNDAYWDNVNTGSGGLTYQGVAPPLYGTEMTNVTGMVYSAGYIYYTLKGKNGLYYRYFEPEDGIVGGTEFTASSSIKFNGMQGVFASGNTVYWSKTSTGDLYSATFTGALAGHAATVTGTGTVANSTADWNSGASFVGP